MIEPLSYALFLDDERYPPSWTPETCSKWIITRNHAETIRAVITHGFPTFVSFDHDLGECYSLGTGMTVAQYLIFLDMNTHTFRFPNNFDYKIHSQNPIGAANIRGLITSYMRHKTGCISLQS